jgi:hypothetical protein
MKPNYDSSTAVKNPSPKRIIVSVTIENVRDASKSLSCEAFVDTAASLMVLPTAWKDRLGYLELTRTVELETITRGTIRGEVYGPVRIQLDGFRPIFTEVSFAEMKTEGDECEPLVGHIALAQSHAAVDILGHRLVRIKHMDLK